MPQLVRMYIRHVLIGFALAALFVGLLLGLDVGGLRRLIQASPVGFLALAMLVIFNGIVFAGVQFAFAVMAMGTDDDRSGGRGAMLPLAGPVPVAAGGGNRGNREGVSFPRA